MKIFTNNEQNNTLSFSLKDKIGRVIDNKKQVNNQTKFTRSKQREKDGFIDRTTPRENYCLEKVKIALYFFFRSFFFFCPNIEFLSFFFFFCLTLTLLPIKALGNFSQNVCFFSTSF